MVRQLLQAGATVNTTNKVYKYTLYVKSDSWFICPIISLITAVTVLISSTCFLHVKVWTGHVTFAVLCSGCTCTHTSQDGCTALYLATQGGHEDVVELMLEGKADPELKTEVINL